MNNTRILIIEDEALIAESLASHAEELGYEVVGVAYSFDEALEKIDLINFNLALIDTNLDDKDEGIELGQIMYEKQIPFIYITSYSDKFTLDKAKVTQPDAYIVKPANKADLFTNIEIAMARNVKSNTEVNVKMIKIKQGHSTILVNVNDILWIKSDHIYMEIKTLTQSYLQRTTFNNLLKQLEGTKVCRVHRSWAVNLKYIQGFSANYLVIEDTKIPISCTYKHMVKATLTPKNNSR